MSEQLSSVARTLSVLEAFNYAEPVLGVSELARKLDMSKSSVHRALSTLLEAGYVTKTPDDRYRLGLKLHELGQRVVSGMRLHEVAHDPLERLRQQSGEAVHLAVLDGIDVVYIDRFESPGLARTFKRLGRRVAAHSSSAGKCLLAFGSHEQVSAVIDTGLPRKGPRTVTSATMFLAVLAQIRVDGYVISIEENEKGISSVGAPVFGRDGSCIAAVSLVGPTSRFQGDMLDGHGRHVRQCANKISTLMGYEPGRVPGPNHDAVRGVA
jgi:IclR family transcriptional regulator, KDG regulon repressor